jgi:hypothetical protein
MIITLIEPQLSTSHGVYLVCIIPAKPMHFSTYNPSITGFSSFFPEPRDVGVARLPFLTHPRFIEFNAYETKGLNWLSSFLTALRSSLCPPATLEDLKLCCAVKEYDLYTILIDDNASGVWAELDGLVIDPLCARLRRVDVILEVFGNEVDIDNVNARVYGILPQLLLPLLSSKGVLHVQVEENY